ncbi:MAG TPA: glycosyltransferase [Anaerolineae bacterium]|nr:glycosyltransferase [Anaerolineae bacterium]
MSTLQTRELLKEQELEDIPTILESVVDLDEVLPKRRNTAWKGIILLYFLLISIAIFYYKIAYFDMSFRSALFAAYGITVTVYLMSRFVIVLFYRPTGDQGYRPTVSIIIPAMNEEEVIQRTLLAAVSVDYPKSKLEVIVVDDGSTDSTWARIEDFCQVYPEAKPIRLPNNRGKREAMAVGIEHSSGEILVFIDSDSIVEPKSFHFILQDFADPEVAAVAGHADVYNATQNALTKMQAIRYFSSFQLMKACESVFDSVTCCSGCFSAYRRAYLLEVLDEWRHQTFLGVNCTYGDDRSLTNKLLRNYKVRYNSLARAYTIVPENYRQFFKQQLRWKKSWTRESLIAIRIFWRKHPVFAASAYLATILPLVSPLLVVRSFLFLPAAGILPWFYVLGIYAMALLFGLFYCFRTPQRPELWVYGVMFSFLYFILVWQTYYAIATLKNSKWGTRG